MRTWAKTITGLALVVVAGAPAVAGHYGMKTPGAVYGGPSAAGKYAKTTMAGHPHCRGGKMGRHGPYATHGPYQRVHAWRHAGPHHYGHRGHMKRPGYGHRGMMGPYQRGDKPYGSPKSPAPTAPATEQPAGGGEAVDAAPKNIVETAIAAEQFATLVSAVKAADLVEALSGDGPFTVFAPTDAAFGNLPEGTVTGLLKDQDALKGVLTYHVAQGRLSAADLLERGSVETLNGSPLDLSQLRVAKADVPASNGVIHIIDEVLMPPR